MTGWGGGGGGGGGGRRWGPDERGSNNARAWMSQSQRAGVSLSVRGLTSREGRAVSREVVMQEMRRHARVRAWWGIMMVIMLWLALLHHTFRLATLTLLKSYAAVLPLELRALDWPTRGHIFRGAYAGDWRDDHMPPLLREEQEGRERRGLRVHVISLPIIQSRAKDGQTTKDGQTVTGPPPASLLHAKGEEAFQHLSHSSLKMLPRMSNGTPLFEAPIFIDESRLRSSRRGHNEHVKLQPKAWEKSLKIRNRLWDEGPEEVHGGSAFDAKTFHHMLPWSTNTIHRVGKGRLAQGRGSDEAALGIRGEGVEQEPGKEEEGLLLPLSRTATAPSSSASKRGKGGIVLA